MAEETENRYAKAEEEYDKATKDLVEEQNRINDEAQQEHLDNLKKVRDGELEPVHAGGAVIGYREPVEVPEEEQGPQVLSPEVAQGGVTAAEGPVAEGSPAAHSGQGAPPANTDAAPTSRRTKKNGDK